MAVLFAMRAARMFSVLRRVRGMAMRSVGVMSSFLVVAGFMVLGCLGVMVRRARMMFRGFLMMFRSFARHYGSLTIVIRPARTVPTYCEARMTSHCLCIAISRQHCAQVTSNRSRQASSHRFAPNRAAAVAWRIFPFMKIRGQAILSIRARAGPHRTIMMRAEVRSCANAMSPSWD
jgi:hypothetical protein